MWPSCAAGGMRWPCANVDGSMSCSMRPGGACAMRCAVTLIRSIDNRSGRRAWGWWAGLVAGVARRTRGWSSQIWFCFRRRVALRFFVMAVAHHLPSLLFFTASIADSIGRGGSNKNRFPSAGGYKDVFVHDNHPCTSPPHVWQIA